MTMRRATCHVCESPRLRKRPFGYSFNNRRLTGLECRTCGIIFIDPQPTSGEIAQMYSKEYFEGDFRCGHAGSYFEEEAVSQLADSPLIEKIRKHKPSGKFLEIGCAGGAFLNAARGAGYDVQGIEFSSDAASLARTNFNLPVETGDVLENDYPDDSFDVVFMGDVLEHLPDPRRTIAGIQRIMKPGGVLVIECPMQTNTLFSRLGFFIYGLAGKEVTVNLPPYHIFEYRERSMRYLLDHAGFVVVEVNQGLISPREIALRGSRLQNIAKKFFQYPNYFLTSLFGVLGDRIEVFATKK